MRKKERQRESEIKRERKCKNERDRTVKTLLEFFPNVTCHKAIDFNFE